MIITCGTCGKEFARSPSKVALAATHYCSRACADIGHVGRRHPAEAVARMRANTGRVLATVSLVCEQCGRPFERVTGQTRHSKRHFCSRACGFAAHRGASAANFTGDESTRRSAHIRAITATPRRPCDACGAEPPTLRRLHRHHVDLNPWNNAPENLRILCASCHMRLHAALRRAGNCASTSV